MIRDPIVDLLLLLEAQASVALSHDPEVQTFSLDPGASRRTSGNDDGLTESNPHDDA